MAGPFVLGLLPKEASDSLRYVDDISLAVIAFIAGSELYLKELQSRLRGILLNTAGIVVVAFTLISVALFFLQSLIPFSVLVLFFGRSLLMEFIFFFGFSDVHLFNLKLHTSVIPST